MSEYIPETSVVRVSYGWTGHDSYVESNRWAKEAEFDRWLEAHDREIAAKAWDEGAEMGHRLYAENMYVIGIRNPYKNGETL